eukprot:s5880_g3.t1
MARIHCLLCLIAVAQPPAGEAAVPEFPSWPQPLARESSTRTFGQGILGKTWPQSSVAIQKQAVAAKPQRRLRRRVQGSKDRAYVWKDHRRLQEERCSRAAANAANTMPRFHRKPRGGGPAIRAKMVRTFVSLGSIALWRKIRQKDASLTVPHEEYCESCELCLAFRNSLAESERPKWPCEPCPTVGGGICEPASICQIANDGIDNTCPLQKGCDANIQCRPDEYCMDCEKCAAYRESLPPEHRVYWPCGYCPTGRGGLCERRVFCSVANDGEDSGTVIMALKSTVTSMVTMGSADDVGSVADGDN